MDVYSNQNASERLISGVGGELSEVEDIWSSMLDSQKYLKASRDSEKIPKV